MKGKMKCGISEKWSVWLEDYGMGGEGIRLDCLYWGAC